MLKPPKLAGAGQLRLFVEELGFDWSCEVLDVHPATMRRWLREASPVPKAALMALYWLTNYGFSEACSEAHWSHQIMLGKLAALEAQLKLRASFPAIAHGLGSLRHPARNMPRFAGCNESPVTGRQRQFECPRQMEVRHIVRTQVVGA